MTRFFPRLLRQFGLILAVSVIALGALLGVDYWRVGSVPAPCPDTSDPDRAAIVLSGGPDYQRTRRAVALYEASRVGTLVFSGAGNGGDSAPRLAREARRLGVADTDIVVEDRARSTADNLAFSCALAPVRDTEHIALVTHRFHSYRAWLTAKRQCPTHHFCSAPADYPVSADRRWSETRKLFAYQLLGRAAFW